MSYGFNEDKSKFELDVVFSEINVNIQGKADVHHTHNAADVVDGVLAVERGGTGQSTLQAFRNAAGLGNTTGALPVANGGTGATAAASARANIGATSRRNVTANYAGSTANNPDFLLKTFTGSFSISGTSFPQNHDVGVGVSGYTAIAVAGFSSIAASQPTARVGAIVKNATTATLRLEYTSGGSGQCSYTLQILYVRTALLNQ